jgi:hypothetical protein
MKETSIRNWSILGLVLMTASTIAAAIVPGNPNGKVANNGTLRVSDESLLVYTCIPQSSAMSCTATLVTNTTTSSFDSFDANSLQTIGNTSQTDANDGLDWNSVLG